MSGSEPLVGVVTPFYNTAGFLEECIESVLRQSHTNFEYVLVDNNSTDGSAEIASRNAARDPRLRVVRTPSLLSQVQNYNFALGQLSADVRYVKIVQADDWLFPRCISELVALADAHPSVGVVGSYELRETEVHCTGLHPNRNVLSGRDACRLQLLEKLYLFGTPSTVLYRGDVVRGRTPFYEEHRLHEDTEVIYEVLADHDFGFVHQVLSFTRMQSGSISSFTRGFHALDWLILVKRYGPRYLNQQEYADALEEGYRWYYRSLAEWWFRELLRPAELKKGFWAYQRQGLDSMGERLRPGFLAKHVSAVAIEQLFAPLRMARAIQRLASRQRQGATDGAPR